MKVHLWCAVTVLVWAFGAPSPTFAQQKAAVEGFGGLTLNSFQAQQPSFGATFSFDLTPGIQAIAEGGRIGNVLPLLADTAFSVSQSGLQASAFYGEGGVRFIPAMQHVAPYAEASAGFARLSVTDTRLDAIGNAAATIGLALVGRNTPTAGFGAGVLLRSGPVVIDLGYRYKQLFANEVVQAALGFGQPLRTHQLRVGVGVRF